MRLKINQLETHLKNSTNKSIYVVSGDEPFQKQECIDQIRNHYKKQGFNERVVLNVSKGFDWNLINEANNNLSLFSFPFNVIDIEHFLLLHSSIIEKFKSSTIPVCLTLELLNRIN